MDLRRLQEEATPVRPCIVVIERICIFGLKKRDMVEPVPVAVVPPEVVVPSVEVVPPVVVVPSVEVVPPVVVVPPAVPRTPKQKPYIAKRTRYSRLAKIPKPTSERKTSLNDNSINSCNAILD
ncbi:unnamed protein product [Orchesella dallaii]|uniref:Uncharacterized protein n=1 Tax=Orchesella dallaii TaxID=48710 RepID=A0ABP1RNJ1_9HEXA